MVANISKKLSNPGGSNITKRGRHHHKGPDDFPPGGWRTFTDGVFTLGGVFWDSGAGAAGVTGLSSVGAGWDSSALSCSSATSACSFWKRKETWILV